MGAMRTLLTLNYAIFLLSLLLSLLLLLLFSLFSLLLLLSFLLLSMSLLCCCLYCCCHYYSCCLLVAIVHVCYDSNYIKGENGKHITIVTAIKIVVSVFTPQLCGSFLLQYECTRRGIEREWSKLLCTGQLD